MAKKKKPAPGKPKAGAKKPRKKAAPKGRKIISRSKPATRQKEKRVKNKAKMATSKGKPLAKKLVAKKLVPRHVPKAPVKRPTVAKPTPPKAVTKRSALKSQPSPPSLVKAKTPSTPGAPVPAAKKEAGKTAAQKLVVPKGPIMAVMTGVDPLSGPVRTLKRALKERFIVEIYVRSTPFALYELISTPSGFSKWFCDDVNVRGEEFTFIWGNEEETAEVLSRKQGELIRMHWKDDEDEGSFFELRIRIDPLTNEVAMVITDHAWPDELQEARQLWESQIATLQRVLGA